ncbi:GNAT family N-acetyltransferase [Streptomyces sp. NPDC026092]|uniref:GNAT family N-acetyltransferase n=1 Tax=Streptomyces sp. NPDC026092 TaxID=3154797 RepID=UPI0033CFCFA2
MIEYGFTDRDGRAIRLAEVTDDNWRAVADVAPQDDQRRFVAALAARYLLLSWRGGEWNSLAVTADDVVVGHVMWAYDDGDGSHWIGGMVVDASEQGKGVGRGAVRALVRWLSELPDFREVRLSYHPDNIPAAHLYESIGFTLTGEKEDDEVVAVMSAGRAA